MKNIPQVTVSVCIPSHNGEKFLAATIMSILSQTHQNFELLISDDCSTDGTVDVVRQFDDPRIRFLEHRKRIGPAANWNILLHQAKGKYIKMVGHDDLLHRTCLERQVGVMEDNQEVETVLVSCFRTIINEKNEEIYIRGLKHCSGKLSGREAIRKALLSGGNPIGEPVAGLFRADLVDKGVKYDQAIPYCIDLDFWAQVLTHGNFHIIKEPLCSFRVSTEAWSIKLVNAQNRQWREFVARLAEDPYYRLGKRDQVVSILRGTFVGLSRRIFYTIHRSGKK